MKLQYQLSNGNWVDCGDRTDEFFQRACEYNRLSAAGKINDPTTYATDRCMTPDEVREGLKSGASLGHRGGDWYANIRDGEVAEQKNAEIRAQRAAAASNDKRPFLRCKNCGQTGRSGAYPFSTLPGSGYCDDCA